MADNKTQQHRRKLQTRRFGQTAVEMNTELIGRNVGDLNHEEQIKFNIIVGDILGLIDANQNIILYVAPEP